jgi:arylsulfatase A-like enzyme
MWWPGTIPAGTDTEEIATTLDFMPTLAALAGAELPQDRILDGYDITELLKAGQPGQSGYERFFYWSNKHITALRIGDLKLRMQIDHKTKERKAPELYHLAEDISERNNLASQMPEVVEQMTKIMLNAEVGQLAGR